MGTNFYAVKPISAKEHEEIEKALAERQYKRVQELIEEGEKRYHIGKRSGGWQFLFCTNHSHLAPWEPTRASLDEFLHREDIIIEDEDGDRFTPEEFWEEIGPWLYHDEDHINGEDYDRIEPNHSYRLRDTEFTTAEGLRWTEDADFS